MATAAISPPSQQSYTVSITVTVGNGMKTINFQLTLE
jgi:hypothetical protein